MRLVDADALRQAMYHEAFETDSDMQKWDSGCWIRYKMFEKHIETAPTIDPVKHGKWTEIDIKDYKALCSECGTWSPVMGKFCPECGARMDGE